MNKRQAISAVLCVVESSPIIFTTGYSSRIGASIADRLNHFYMTGSMGLALPLGVGVALATRRPTVVVDGDGSLLMNPAGLLAASAHPDLPLIHIVLDDGVYASTGGQATGASAVDLIGWATSSGFRRAHTVADADELAKTVHDSIQSCSSPTFIRCLIESGDCAPGPRIEIPLEGISRRFSRFLAQQAHESRGMAQAN